MLPVVARADHRRSQDSGRPAEKRSVSRVDGKPVHLLPPLRRPTCNIVIRPGDDPTSRCEPAIWAGSFHGLIVISDKQATFASCLIHRYRLVSLGVRASGQRHRHRRTSAVDPASLLIGSNRFLEPNMPLPADLPSSSLSQCTVTEPTNLHKE